VTQRVVARDAGNGTIVANRVIVASRRLDRAVGLLGRSRLEVSTLKPWRMRLPKPGAYSVLELPAGTLLTSPVKVGDRIQIQ
jgi:uncharacterized membrane protein (UPF0127 family)